MDKKSILNLARGLIEENHDNLNFPDRYLEHVGNVYDTSEIVIGNVMKKYPKIPINFKEVILASGYHDIGRPLHKDQIFHELRGADYIEKNGLKMGVANSIKDIYRIAQMVRPHGFVYELWQNPECSGRKKEFLSFDVSLLLPRTWQEAIVAYSDLVSLNGERIKANERFKDLLERYKNNPEYKDRLVVEVAELAEHRILELVERVEALEMGELSEAEIERYGFL